MDPVFLSCHKFLHSANNPVSMNIAWRSREWKVYLDLLSSYYMLCPTHVLSFNALKKFSKDITIPFYRLENWGWEKLIWINSKIQEVTVESCVLTQPEFSPLRHTCCLSGVTWDASQRLLYLPPKIIFLTDLLWCLNISHLWLFFLN